MEGIMMRHKDKYSIAVRKPDGEIVCKVEDYKSVLGNSPIWKKPILRGISSFLNSLIVGTKCLMYSAEFFEEEAEEKEKSSRSPKHREKTMTQEQKKKQEKKEQWLMYGTVAFSLVLAVALFMVGPYLLASLARNLGASEAVVTILEAIVKLAVFLGYMILISRMKDIQRTFMYHGAEHKCINCVEHGMPLTVENVLKSSRQHKRCGTSFLLLVMVVSILVHFVFVFVPVMWIRVVGRILMIPLVAGVAFEFIRLAGNSDNPLVSFLSKPGLALQKLTTREPDASMAEVAITAVEAVFDWRAYLKEEFGVDVSREEQEEKKI